MKKRNTYFYPQLDIYIFLETTKHDKKDRSNQPPPKNTKEKSKKDQKALLRLLELVWFFSNTISVVAVDIYIAMTWLRKSTNLPTFGIKVLPFLIRTHRKQM